MSYTLFANTARAADLGDTDPESRLEKSRPEISIISYLHLPDVVTAIAWSSTTHRLAVSHNWGRVITVYDATGKIVSEVHNEYATLSPSLAFLPSGSALIAPSADAAPAAANAMVSIWDTNTGSLLRRVPGPFPKGDWTANRARAFALARNGKRLAAITENSRGNPLLSL